MIVYKAETDAVRTNIICLVEEEIVEDAAVSEGIIRIDVVEVDEKEVYVEGVNAIELNVVVALGEVDIQVVVVGIERINVI